MSKNMEVFKLAIKKRLRERAMTFGELAKSLGMSHEGLSRSIDSKKLQLETYLQICEKLELNAHEFIPNYKVELEESVFTKMLGEIQSELTSLKMKNFKMQSIIEKNGLSLNFNLVSRLRGVNLANIFFAQLLTFLLTI